MKRLTSAAVAIAMIAAAGKVYAEPQATPAAPTAQPGPSAGNPPAVIPPPVSAQPVTPPPVTVQPVTPQPLRPEAATSLGRTLSLAECVATAVQRNPDARASNFEVDAAGAQRSGVRGEFGPRVHVDAYLQQWNSAFNLPFALPGAPGPPPVLTVRDAFAWGATVSLIQPLTALWAILDQYKVQDLGVDLASIQRDATRRDIAFRVAEAYFRLLEASRLSEVASTSVSQLEAQLRQAQSLYVNGVIGKNDLLRAGLALASARQRVIQQRGQIILARGNLAVLMGLAPDTPVDPTPVADEPPSDEGPSIEAAEARAVSDRLELRQVDRTISQADARVGFAKKKLLPQINAVGSYAHTEGSVFAQKDAAFVGLTASWDVWDWGTTTSGITEASARREQARLARSKLEDQLRLEARQAYVGATTAREALSVARTAVAQAEENYRIVGKRFAANTSTSFDLVDAEALLTQARAQVETALYDYLLARAALQRATGEASPHVR